MLNAIIIRKSISFESFDIINKSLENIIKNMPNNELPVQERKQKVDEIWNLLQNHISSKDSVKPDR